MDEEVLPCAAADWITEHSITLAGGLDNGITVPARSLDVPKGR